MKQDVLTVPQEFTLQDSTGRYVYVVDSDGILQVKYFKDNGQYDKYWIGEEGLALGDEFVATNLTKLMPKQKRKANEKIDDCIGFVWCIGCL